VNKGSTGGVSAEAVIGGTLLDAELVVESSLLLSLAFALFALGSFFLMGDENRSPSLVVGLCCCPHLENVESIHENEA